MRQKTKKLLSVVLSLSMAFSVMPLTAYAADESASGGESGAPVLSLTSEANSTTTSGAAFDITYTTSANITITGVQGTSTSAAFNLADSEAENPLTEENIQEIKDLGAVNLTFAPDTLTNDAGDNLSEFTVNAIIADVVFDGDAINAISDNNSENGNMTLSIKVKNTGDNGGGYDDNDYITNAAYVIDLNLTDASGAPIFAKGDSAGTVTVTVPYTWRQDANGGEIYYVSDDGDYEYLGDSSRDNDYFTFKIGHFSTIILTETVDNDVSGVELSTDSDSTTMTVNGTDTVVWEHATGSVFTDGANVTYSSDDPSVVSVNAETGAISAIKAGTATITATVTEGGYKTTATLLITVEEADGKLDQRIVFTSPASYSLRVGRTFNINDYIDEANSVIDPDATLTYLSDDGSIATVDGNGTVRAVARGTANIFVAASETDTHNATISTAFALTVTRSSNGEDSSSSSSGGGGGGSSSSGYSVNVSSASNGTVSVDKDRASSGSTVTITAEPDEGYVVGSVTVTDSDGNEITVRDRGNNEYTFTMPSSRVTIEVEFVEDTTVEEPVDEITEADFSDVSSSDWFYDAVNYVFSKGIMVGVTENTFAPNSSLTRAMIVQMLYSLEGSPEVTGTAPFTDVAIGQWYTNAITWAASNNIVSGMGDGTFAPNNNITREQLAMILYNYAQLKGNAVTASGNLAAFTDGNEVSDWAETAVRWAVGEGLMSGRGNGVLDPTETTTRAEAASMFMRFMESDLA